MQRTVFFFFLLLWAACGPVTTSRFIQQSDIQFEDLAPEQLSSSNIRGFANTCCKEYESYSPDPMHLEYTPMKYVRVNMHFMNSLSGLHNYDEEAGKVFAEGFLRSANKDVANNKQLLLPKGNDIPVLPTQYTYVLTPHPDDPNDDGIYFHYDDDLYYYVVKGKNRNNFTKEVIQKYGVQLDTVLNIFIMPHHPDSVASPTYSPSGCGIALGQAVKIAGAYENNLNYYDLRAVLNHEIGHIYGLSHTWAQNDGCDDTVLHEKCWNYTKDGRCDSTNVSNNVMDYNVFQHAWSPCQIGKIQYNMARTTYRPRNYLIPYWCDLQPGSDITIRDSVHWQSIKDLEGNLTIAKGGVLKVSCRLSIPENGKITVEPGGKLIVNNAHLHNACERSWQGIRIEERAGEKGTVVFIGKARLSNVANDPFAESTD
ncbi:MAG: hypothetical protein KDC44_06660 [Phaeodactylibacter sp.]|nr:hypothetical protein [Phaeodactylibacter sp.]